MEPLEFITLSPQETAKLLSTGSGDAALVFLYIRSTGDSRLLHAREALPLSDQALGWAESLLKQLGLLEVTPQKTRYEKDQAPVYTGEAVAAYAARDPSFAGLQGEISRRLGRVLTSEELKTLLAIRDYLKLPPEVVSMVLTYCLQRTEYYNRSHGTNRNVTIRALEKECYTWANQGITTLPLASEYISKKLSDLEPESRVKRTLGLDRPLADTEKDYIHAWLQWGFQPEAIKAAYEKTVLSTGKLAWRYMNKILLNWHEKGLHTLREIQGEVKAAPADTPAQNVLGESERSAIEALARRHGQKKGDA